MSQGNHERPLTYQPGEILLRTYFVHVHKDGEWQFYSLYPKPYMPMPGYIHEVVAEASMIGLDLDPAKARGPMAVTLATGGITGVGSKWKLDG